MATTRTASAHWEGSLMEGEGQVSLESSGVGTFDVSWPSRAEAAHSTCYSMALSHGLAQAGTPPTTIDTTADVTFQPGTGITGIALKVVGAVPGISAEKFEEAAQAAKVGCPVSQALSAVPITLEVHFQDAS